VASRSSEVNFTKNYTLLFLPEGEKSLTMWLVILTQHTNVTDVTDGQTDGHCTAAYAVLMQAYRGRNPALSGKLALSGCKTVVNNLQPAYMHFF